MYAYVKRLAKETQMIVAYIHEIYSISRVFVKLYDIAIDYSGHISMPYSIRVAPLLRIVFVMNKKSYTIRVYFVTIAISTETRRMIYFVHT